MYIIVSLRIFPEKYLALKYNFFTCNFAKKLICLYVEIARMWFFMTSVLHLSVIFFILYLETSSLKQNVFNNIYFYVKVKHLSFSLYDLVKCINLYIKHFKTCGFQDFRASSIHNSFLITARDIRFEAKCF